MSGRSVANARFLADVNQAHARLQQEGWVAQDGMLVDIDGKRINAPRDLLYKLFQDKEWAQGRCNDIWACLAKLGAYEGRSVRGEGRGQMAYRLEASWRGRSVTMTELIPTLKSRIVDDDTRAIAAAESKPKVEEVADMDAICTQPIAEVLAGSMLDEGLAQTPVGILQIISDLLELRDDYLQRIWMCCIIIADGHRQNAALHEQVRALQADNDQLRAALAAREQADSKGRSLINRVSGVLNRQKA